jgi:hypothetical protein
MSAKNCLRLSCFLVLSALFAVAQDQAVPWQSQHLGRVHDWSARHITTSGGLTTQNLRTAQLEPRVLLQLRERNMLTEREMNILDGFNPIKFPNPGNRTVIIDGTPGNGKRGAKVDWSVSLGTGHVAANMFPAKYSFNTNGTPNCTTDYVVYGLNVAGVNNRQANMVGINRLYSGTPTGLCGTNPVVNWAYNGSTAAGKVLTSTVPSLDGKKIAFVESGTNSAVFHILTWLAGQGTVTRSVTPTKPPNCTAATSCLVSVTFSTTATDTFASPWIDYATDKAFVASDDGKVYRISCVFTCALNTAPVVDWTYTLPVAGTGGATPRPNGGVYNSPYGYLIIGDQLGELWVINAGGTTPTLHAGPVMIGGGGCSTINPPGRTGTPSPCTPTGTAFGIPDSVLLDASGASQRILAFSGNNGTSAVVAQLTQDLTGLVSVPIGEGGVDIHSGAFDNAYFGATPATGNIFLCGTGTTDTTPYHYWIGFTAYPVMNSTTTGSLQRLAGATGVPCAPYTEFFNPNLNLGGVVGHHDLLVSGLVSANPGYIISNDISLGSVPGALTFVQYNGGISGVVIDNDSNSAQASSVYFSTLGTVNVGSCANELCAVKLTQSALQ